MDAEATIRQVDLENLAHLAVSVAADGGLEGHIMDAIAPEMLRKQLLLAADAEDLAMTVAHLYPQVRVQDLLKDDEDPGPRSSSDPARSAYVWFWALSKEIRRAEQTGRTASKPTDDRL